MSALASLPHVLFADTDPASVEASILTAYEAQTGSTLYPGDPVRLFLESLAYVIVVQNNTLNLAGQQNLLAYAVGPHLDHIGAMVGTHRLGSATAMVVQRFTLAAPLDFAVLIPAGTRIATADTRLSFITQETVSIAKGQTFASTAALCMSTGAGANGLVPGQVNKMVDPVAYVASTGNVSVSALGADVESDASYRARIQLAPEAYTNAGSSGAYRFHALSVHQDIAEVSVWQPKPGTVDIRPVMRGGELPPEDILALIRATCSAEDVRPLTDTVIVAAPEVLPYEIRVQWSLRAEDSPLAATIQARVVAAVEDFRLWQRSAPGRDINPTRLVSLMEQAGARRVVVDAPAYTVIEARQLARESSVHLSFLGIEQE